MSTQLGHHFRDTIEKIVSGIIDEKKVCCSNSPYLPFITLTRGCLWSCVDCSWKVVSRFSQKDRQTTLNVKRDSVWIDKLVHLPVIITSNGNSESLRMRWMYFEEQLNVVKNKRTLWVVRFEHCGIRFDADRLLMHPGRAPGPRGDEVGTIARVPASGGG